MPINGLSHDQANMQPVNASNPLDLKGNKGTFYIQGSGFLSTTTVTMKGDRCNSGKKHEKTFDFTYTPSPAGSTTTIRVDVTKVKNKDTNDPCGKGKDTEGDSSLTVTTTTGGTPTNYDTTAVTYPT